MDFLTTNNSIKDHRITLLLLLSIILLSIEVTSASPVKNPNLRKNHCRTHIFSPMCRGQQKRDVLSRLNDDYRLSPLESDYSGIDRSRDLVLLGELLKKAIEIPPDFDSENNYVK